MKNRQGQALIIVVIIIAVIMAVFANSLTTRLRYHSQEETEIYQREQALYLAEAGVNKMIFNINSGTTYNDGDTITENFSGIGNYTATYHTPDDSGFDGSSYIESTGTVGEISRKVFASVVSLRDAFKYCLYTSKGGRDGIKDDSYFKNNKYGDNYLYNTTNAVTPYPDPIFYSYITASNNFDKYIEETGSAPTYKIQSSDLGNVIYIHTEKANATLTIDFSNVSPVDPFSLSIITDAENVTIKNLYPHPSFPQSSTTTWSGAENSKDNNKTYPILVHLGNGTTTFNLTTNYILRNWTLKLNGFLYTAGAIDMEYVEYCVWLWGWWCWRAYGEIDGEVMEKNPQQEGKLGGSDGQRTSINYTADYYTTPPPHFIPTKIFPGSFREEY